jgi:hypothetical protein
METALVGAKFLSGEEHDPNVNHGAVPSMCLLPLFHPPCLPEDAPALGHISHDGHAYNCKNPAVMRRSFHMLEHSFVLRYAC